MFLYGARLFLPDCVAYRIDLLEVLLRNNVGYLEDSVVHDLISLWTKARKELSSGR